MPTGPNLEKNRRIYESLQLGFPCKATYQNVMSAKIRNGLGDNCQWLVSMFETNVIEASDMLCRNFRSAL